MPRAIEVVIADKNPLILTGLRHLVAEDERFRVVATASDGERFLEAVDRLPFDIGVIGWVMPYLDGAEILRRLEGKENAPRIVVYTGSLDNDIPRQVMALGGAGFVSKAQPPEKLLDVLASVADGQMVFPLIDVRNLYLDPFASLTPRERELLEVLAEGATNQRIARRFDISVNTVKFHLKNLYEKMSVENRSQAVATFVQKRREKV